MKDRIVPTGRIKLGSVGPTIQSKTLSSTTGESILKAGPASSGVEALGANNNVNAMGLV